MPPSDLPEAAGSAHLASIQGRVSFHRDHVPTGIHIGLVGIDPAAGNLRVFRWFPVSSESPSQEGVHTTFAWEVQDLIPGKYRITYEKTSIQGVSLAPGPNEVFAVIGEPRTLVLQLKDSQTGEPVLGANIAWASQVDEQPVGALSVEFRQEGLLSTAGTYRFTAVQTERIFITVFAKGYAVLFTDVYLADGEEQVVTLEPICRFQISVQDQSPEPSLSTKELTLGFRFSISVGGQLYSPVSAGWSGGESGRELFATFDIPYTRAGEWELVIPEGVELVEIDNCPAGPGQTIHATVR